MLVSSDYIVEEPSDDDDLAAPVTTNSSVKLSTKSEKMSTALCIRPRGELVETLCNARCRRRRCRRRSKLHAMQYISNTLSFCCKTVDYIERKAIRFHSESPALCAAESTSTTPPPRHDAIVRAPRLFRHPTDEQLQQIAPLLNQAAETRSLERVLHFLAQSRFNLEATLPSSANRGTLLHWAARRDMLVLADYLLQRGVDPGSLDAAKR